MERQPGSKRTRKRYHHARDHLNLCNCWYCTPGKVKRAIAASSKSARRRAIDEQLER